MWRNLYIQNTIGMVFAIIFIILAVFIISWSITCLFVYWISLLWVNTPFAFNWSLEFATGVWLILCLIGSFCGAKINLND